jgi:hypothetical protein
MRKYEKRAATWLMLNPQAYLYFNAYAMQMVNAGQKFGAKLIAERIRWEVKLKRVGDFKWNNNYTSEVARTWAEKNPRYAHLLSFRDKN